VKANQNTIRVGFFNSAIITKNSKFYYKSRNKMQITSKKTISRCFKNFKKNSHCSAAKTSIKSASIEIEPPQKVHRLNQQIHPLLGVHTTIIFTTLSSESFGNKNIRLIDCRELPKQKVHLYPTF
jgi:hypothetical protein